LYLFVLRMLVYLYCVAVNDYVQTKKRFSTIITIICRISKFINTKSFHPSVRYKFPIHTASSYRVVFFSCIFVFSEKVIICPSHRFTLLYPPRTPLAAPRPRPPRLPPLPLPPRLETPAPSFGFKIGDSGLMMVGRGLA